MNGPAKITIKELNHKDHGEQILRCLPVQAVKRALRQLRAEECFAVVDRPLWYNRLSDYQKVELNDWYEKWLRVTETFEIPKRPDWLED